MAELAEGSIVDGRYRVAERLGSGGMADVFCVEDQQLGRKVALKLLHRRFAADGQFVERFKREAQSAAGLQHPNVVGVYDRGEWDGTYYIAMEYLPGRTLKDLVRAEAPLAPERAIDITIQILKAARFAHKRGIVHRDLKPHNVIIDDEDRVKVTDFGIARAGASDMTETGSILGTAQYLSPEQAQGHAVGPTSDLYSVGVILYELLTGRVPFEADSAVTIALKHVSEQPETPSALNPAVPPALEQVTLWALAKDPAQRPQDADAFLAALEEVRAGLAAGDGGPPSTSAWAVATSSEEPEAATNRRRRLLILAVLAILLVGGAIAAFLLTRPEKRDVPRVVGQSLTVAQARLQNQGFEVNAIRRTSDRPKDEVIAQNPLAGDKVTKGATITLTVSDGPGQGTVPDVTGKTLASATKALKKAGFKVRSRTGPSTGVPRGQVSTQTPDPGTQVDKGSTITLTVSTGPPLVSVPSVVGKARAEARGALEGAGFQVSESEQDSSSPAGSVIAQSPSGGTSVARGSTVTITVAKAAQKPKAKPATVKVPDVTGEDAKAAARDLAAAGLSANVTHKDVGTVDQDGQVLSQSPGAGGQVRKGSSVTIVVGKLKVQTTSGSTSSSSSSTGGGNP